MPFTENVRCVCECLTDFTIFLHFFHFIFLFLFLIFKDQLDRHVKLPLRQLATTTTTATTSSCQSLEGNGRSNPSRREPCHAMPCQLRRGAYTIISDNYAIFCLPLSLLLSPAVARLTGIENFHFTFHIFIRQLPNFLVFSHKLYAMASD